jgi:hypothetical protein
MYSGSMGAGAKLPYGIAGWDYPTPGYGGRYLGNIFDDIQKIAGKVGIVSSELSNVASGKSDIATIPKDQATITFPVGGGVQKAIPLWVIGAGAAGLLYLAFRPRRR